MKIKNLILSAITALSIFTLTTINAEAVTKEINKNNTCPQSIKLQSNQTELFYMYSNKYGNYFLDPKTDTENVIYVGHEDFMFTQDMYHHGKKFIGTFEDDTLWELIDLKLMDSEVAYCDSSLTKGLEYNQTSLFYMYSNETGHYFLDPNAEYENVIYVGKKDIILDNKYSLDAGELHHGQRFIGTFTDSAMWELTGLERVENE